MKSYTGIEDIITCIDEVVNLYWRNRILVLMKLYKYKILSKPVYIFGNMISPIQVRYTISPIPVYDFANAGLRFRQYWYTISEC